MPEFLDLPEPPDIIVRIPTSEERVSYTLFDHTNRLHQNLGAQTVNTMRAGEQPWADFATLTALNRPPYKPEDEVIPIVLNEAGLALESLDLTIKLSPFPEETTDVFTQRYPDIRFTQRDVAFQYELVRDNDGAPKLLSTREHEQIGVYHGDVFTPFVTLLDWAHPVMLAQE